MMERIMESGQVCCDHKKVVITGAHPYRDLAPWSDRSWCFWALNEINQPVIDRHFELHPRELQNEREWTFLRTLDVPVYLFDPPWPGVTTGVRYPLKEVEERFGSYFTCTFAYQIALALYEGFTTIGLYGVELLTGTKRERTVEYACVSWWLGFAEGRGVSIERPPNSCLANHPYRYGAEYHQEKDWVDAKIRGLDWGDAAEQLLKPEELEYLKRIQRAYRQSRRIG